MQPDVNTLCTGVGSCCALGKNILYGQMAKSSREEVCFCEKNGISLKKMINEDLRIENTPMQRSMGDFYTCCVYLLQKMRSLPFG